MRCHHWSFGNSRCCSCWACHNSLLNVCNVDRWVDNHHRSKQRNYLALRYGQRWWRSHGDTDATGSTEGQDAFRFALPTGVINAWAMNISGGNDDRGAFCSGVSEMRFTGQIQGRYGDPEEAQRVAIQLCGALPIRSDGRLVMLRQTAPPSIALEFMTVEGVDGQQAVFSISIPLDCVVTVS